MASGFYSEAHQRTFVRFGSIASIPSRLAMSGLASTADVRDTMPIFAFGPEGDAPTVLGVIYQQIGSVQLSL